jgi:MFS family permease
MFALAVSTNFALACLSMTCAGIGWMFACNSTYSAILMASPQWVRARGVAIYLLVFQGCLAIGSPAWGAVADALTMPKALIIAAGILGLGCVANLRYRLIIVEQLDMRNSGPWPKVETSVTPHPDQGPVLVTIEYQIDPTKSVDFAQSMGILEKQRRRNGAFQWHLFINLSAPGVYTESFFVETWSEYLRQRDRATVDDIAAEDLVCHFHIAHDSPKITRFISERRKSNQ